MDKNKGKVKLNDELLDKVSGGAYVCGSAEGVACPSCKNPDGTPYTGPHVAHLNYEFVNGVYEVGNTEIFCGICGCQLA